MSLFIGLESIIEPEVTEVDILKNEIEILQLEKITDQEMFSLESAINSLDVLVRATNNFKEFGSTESMEAFLGDELITIQNLSTEGISDIVKTIVEKIKAFIKKIMGLFSNKSKKLKKLIDKTEAIEAKIKGKVDYEASKNVKILVAKKADDVETELEFFQVANDVMIDIATKDVAIDIDFKIDQIDVKVEKSNIIKFEAPLCETKEITLEKNGRMSDDKMFTFNTTLSNAKIILNIEQRLKKLQQLTGKIKSPEGAKKLQRDIALFVKLYNWCVASLTKTISGRLKTYKALKLKK